MTIEEYSEFFWYHNQLKLIKMYKRVENFLCWVKSICDDNDVRRTRYLDYLIDPISYGK